MDSRSVAVGSGGQFLDSRSVAGGSGGQVWTSRSVLFSILRLWDSILDLKISIFFNSEALGHWIREEFTIISGFGTVFTII